MIAPIIECDRFFLELWSVQVGDITGVLWVEFLSFFFVILL